MIQEPKNLFSFSLLRQALEAVGVSDYPVDGPLYHHQLAPKEKETQSCYGMRVVRRMTA